MTRDRMILLLRARLKDAERSIRNNSEEMRYISRMFEEIGEKQNAENALHTANFILCAAAQLAGNKEN